MTVADVKWIKIVTDIFDDEKILLIESMPEADAIIVIWFKLLCMAGKQNNSGVFLLNGRIAYTDEMFATIFRRPLNTVRLALKTFEQFGMIEIINNTVTIPNWEKHQQIDALEASREATKHRVARYREKQKQLADGRNVTCNVTVTPGNADRIDKNREDKSREEEIRDIDDEEDNAGACAGEVNPYGGDRIGGTENSLRPAATSRSEASPLGLMEGGLGSAERETVERYASNSLLAMSATAMEEIAGYVDALSEEIVRHAIDIALDNGVRKWAYVRAILMDYTAAGVKSVAEAKAYDERKRKKNRLGGGKDGPYAGLDRSRNLVPEKYGGGEVL